MPTSGTHLRFANGAEVQLGVVIDALPIDPANPQMRVNVRPLNQGADHKEVLVSLAPGVTRNLRRGQIVELYFVNGSPQLAIATGHVYNLDEPNSVYGDPLNTVIFRKPDDFIIHHDETGSYFRFRNAGSTDLIAGPDLSPLIFDFVTLSKLALNITEYVPPGYPPATVTDANGRTTTPVPPPPTRAKITLKMPLGATLTFDEPANGQSTFSYAHPSGATATVDKDGVWKFTAPQKVLIVAPDLELGNDNGQVLAYKSDVDTLQSYIDGHSHKNVQSGLGVSGTPVAPAPRAVGTTRTHAV